MPSGVAFFDMHTIVIEKMRKSVYNRTCYQPKEDGRMENGINLGDVIQTRKPHPCGSDIWTVIRTGADIKIKCQGCGRIVMLDREVFLKRRKKVIQAAVPPEAAREEQTDHAD